MDSNAVNGTLVFLQFLSGDWPYY